MLLQFIVLLVSVLYILKFRNEFFLFLYLGIFHLLGTLLTAAYVFFLLVVTSYLISSPALVMKLTAHVCADLLFHFPVHFHGMVQR